MQNKSDMKAQGLVRVKVQWFDADLVTKMRTQHFFFARVPSIGETINLPKPFPTLEVANVEWDCLTGAARIYLDCVGMAHHPKTGKSAVDLLDYGFSRETD